MTTTFAKHGTVNSTMTTETSNTTINTSTTTTNTTNTTTTMKRVQGKVICITGANRGIGKALVEAFWKEGASKIYAAVRNLETLQTVQYRGCDADAAADDDDDDDDDDNTESQSIVPLYMDLSKPSSIYEAAKVATDVQILINNAGILSRTEPLDDDAVERLQDEMNVNVYGMMHLAKAFEKNLIQNATATAAAAANAVTVSHSYFIQLNSVASIRCSVSNASTYSASKAAAFSMTQGLRLSWQNKPIHVVSVHPGPIATDMIANLGGPLADMAEPPTTVAHAILEAIASSAPPPFLVFPDQMATNLGIAYDSYAKTVFEDGKPYGYEDNDGNE